MADEKVYLNTFSSVKRNDYGTKLYIKNVDALYAELKANANEDGSIRINLSNRTTADKYGNNAYAALDTWKPNRDANTNNQAVFAPTQQNKNNVEVATPVAANDGLPF
jgi:hypothetical protein